MGRQRHLGALTGFVVALVVFGPTLWSTGYLLHYDMVFVPHLPLSRGTLGLDGGVPRAVPNDIVVALLSLALPGWLVQRLVLVGAFVVIGAGVDRYVGQGLSRPRSEGTAGGSAGPANPALFAVAATVFVCWNPWVGERLAIGHWGYLWGYAGLVWAVVGGLEVRRRARLSAAGSVVRGSGVITGLVLSALSGSTGAVLVAMALAVLLLWRGQGRPTMAKAGWLALAWVGLNAAWWFPFLTLAPSGAADAAGVRAFASHSDSTLGLVGSVLTGGGIWNSSAWFASRDNVALALVALVLLVAGLVTLVRARRPDAAPLAAIAALGVVLALLGSVPPTRGLLEAVVLHVPGGGLLRDGQKFAALLVVPAGLGFGHLVAGLWERGRGTLLAPAAALLAILGPVAALPGLAWAKQGQWHAAHYPVDIDDVPTIITDPGGVAVFPWQLYRQYAWNGHTVVLDPWQRVLSSPVLVNDALPLRAGIVKGENPDAAAVTKALATPQAGRDARVVAALRQAGVRYVLVELDQPRSVGEAPDVGKVVYSSATVVVRDLGDPGEAALQRHRMPWWAPAGLVLAGLSLAVVLGSSVRRQGRRPADGRSRSRRRDA